MGFLMNRHNRKLAVIKADTRKLSAATRYVAHANGFGNRNQKVTTGAKTPGGLSNSGMSRLYDHGELRMNVRDAMFDSLAGRGMATRFADTIADTGMKAKFEPSHATLGLTPETAAEWGQARSEEFHQWMLSKASSLDEVNNGYQNQWLYSFCQQRDNDMYVRLSYSRDKRLLNPLQVQFLDPDQLLGFCYTSTDGTSQELNHGIKYDSKGREKSFTFLVANKEGGFDEVSVPKYGEKSGKVYIIHAFRREFAGQKQGIPLFSHLLQEMEDITTLKTSHIQKAINQSTYGFYTKPSENADASGGPDDYANESVEVIKDFMGGSEIDAAAGTSQEALNTMTLGILNEQTVRQPGNIWWTGAAKGEEMEAVKQTAPVDGFAEFVDSLVSYLSSSSGMPIEVLKMKFGQNYSASRATLVLFWRIVNMWRAEMTADYLNILAKAWMSEEVAAGRVKAPGWSDPRMQAAWLNCRWIGSDMPDIDPKKTAEAVALRTTMGHETLEDGALKHNGSDAKANREQLAKELPELGVAPWNTNYVSSEEDEDDDEKSDTTD